MSATNASQSLSNVFCLFVFNVANSTPVGHNQVLKLNRTKISECITLGNKSIYNRSVCVCVCVCDLQHTTHFFSGSWLKKCEKHCLYFLKWFIWDTDRVK